MLPPDDRIDEGGCDADSTANSTSAQSMSTQQQHQHQHIHSTFMPSVAHSSPPLSESCHAASPRNIYHIDFQCIKRNGAPFLCPLCGPTVAFAVWADWKTHWYRDHDRLYFKVRVQRTPNSGLNLKRKEHDADITRNVKRRKLNPRVAGVEVLCKICYANCANNAGLSNHADCLPRDERGALRGEAARE